MSYLTSLALMFTLALPGVGLAAGGGGGSGGGSGGSSGDKEPTKTETTTDCKKSEVWDAKAKKCVDATDGVTTGQLDNDTLYNAARELAHYGRADDALVVVSAMTEGDSDRVLTFKGFANRLIGNVDVGMHYYDVALAQNPDNIQARSYMGQAYILQGKKDLAVAQLDEIVKRGGSGSWAEHSLREAIETGEVYTW